MKRILRESKLLLSPSGHLLNDGLAAIKSLPLVLEGGALELTF